MAKTAFDIYAETFKKMQERANVPDFPDMPELVPEDPLAGIGEMPPMLPEEFGGGRPRPVSPALPEEDFGEAVPGASAGPGEIIPEQSVTGITTPPGGTLTDEENRYLAQKYGGAKAGIYGPGEYRGDTFKGGQEIDVPGGGAVTLPQAQGVDMEMMYVLDPERFQRMFPALVTDKGEFDQVNYNRMQAAKEGIGGRPPEDRLAKQIDYTDREGFERQLIQRLGGIDPRTFNPMAEMEKETTTNLPALFRHIFQGRVSWNDRGSLDPDQNKYWISVKNAYRAQTLEKLKTSHSNAKFGYTEGMKSFDAMAGKQMAEKGKADAEKAKVWKPTDWRANRETIVKDYKTTTLGDVMHQQAAKNLVKGAQHYYDKLRLEGRFSSPLETRDFAVKTAEEMLNKFWDIRGKLDEEKDKLKITQLEKLIKDYLGYVPKSKIIRTK